MIILLLFILIFVLWGEIIGGIGRLNPVAEPFYPENYNVGKPIGDTHLKSINILGCLYVYNKNDNIENLFFDSNFMSKLNDTTYRTKRKLLDYINHPVYGRLSTLILKTQFITVFASFTPAYLLLHDTNNREFIAPESARIRFNKYFENIQNMKFYVNNNMHNNMIYFVNCWEPIMNDIKKFGSNFQLLDVEKIKLKTLELKNKIAKYDKYSASKLSSPFQVADVFVRPGFEEKDEMRSFYYAEDEQFTGGGSDLQQKNHIIKHRDEIVKRLKIYIDIAKIIIDQFYINFTQLLGWKIRKPSEIRLNNVSRIAGWYINSPILETPKQELMFIYLFLSNQEFVLGVMTRFSTRPLFRIQTIALFAISTMLNHKFDILLEDGSIKSLVYTLPTFSNTREGTKYSVFDQIKLFKKAWYVYTKYYRNDKLIKNVRDIFYSSTQSNGDLDIFGGGTLTKKISVPGTFPQRHHLILGNDDVIGRFLVTTQEATRSSKVIDEQQIVVYIDPPTYNDLEETNSIIDNTVAFRSPEGTIVSFKEINNMYNKLLKQAFPDNANITANAKLPLTKANDNVQKLLQFILNLPADVYNSYPVFGITSDHRLISGLKNLPPTYMSLYLLTKANICSQRRVVYISSDIPSGIVNRQALLKNNIKRNYPLIGVCDISATVYQELFDYLIPYTNSDIFLYSHLFEQKIIHIDKNIKDKALGSALTLSILELMCLHGVHSFFECAVSIKLLIGDLLNIDVIKEDIDPVILLDRLRDPIETLFNELKITTKSFPFI